MFFQKLSPPFVSFPHYAAQLLDNLIKTLFPPLKAKSKTDENFNFSLS